MKLPVTISREGIAVEGWFLLALACAAVATGIQAVTVGFHWWYPLTNLVGATLGVYLANRLPGGRNASR
jgi:hypothetical protein